jgi:hypothetical protein
MERERQETISEARHRGPNLGALAAVYTALFLANLGVTAILTRGGHFPSPFITPDSAQAFFSEHGDAVRISAFLQFGAAIPLGIFTATAVSRLQFLGVDVAGVFISLFGGLAASVFAAVSALLQWVLGQPGTAGQSEVMRALHCSASQLVVWDSSYRSVYFSPEFQSFPGLRSFCRAGWFGWG